MYTKKGLIANLRDTFFLIDYEKAVCCFFGYAVSWRSAKKNDSDKMAASSIVKVKKLIPVPWLPCACGLMPV